METRLLDNSEKMHEQMLRTQETTFKLKAEFQAMQKFLPELVKRAEDAVLAEHGIPGIEGVDTRAITKRIRVKGALKSCLSTEGLSDEEALAQSLIHI